MSCSCWLNFSYQKSSRYEKMGYEEEFSKFLLTLISDVDKRIRRGEQRLVLNSQPTPVSIMCADVWLSNIVLHVWTAQRQNASCTMRMIRRHWAVCALVCAWSYEKFVSTVSVRGNFTKFTTPVHLGTKMNWLHFEVKRSSVKITARPNMVK